MRLFVLAPYVFVGDVFICAEWLSPAIRSVAEALDSSPAPTLRPLHATSQSAIYAAFLDSLSIFKGKILQLLHFAVKRTVSCSLPHGSSLHRHGPSFLVQSRRVAHWLSLFPEKHFNILSLFWSWGPHEKAASQMLGPWTLGSKHYTSSAWSILVCIQIYVYK